MKESCVVVGGGLIGLVAAKLLSDKYKQVHLVEQAEELGGLLRSEHFAGSSHHFDYGPHILTLTNIEKLDRFLFGDLDKLNENWNSFSSLKDISYFKGWNSGSPLIDSTKLDKDLYQKGITELEEIDKLDTALSRYEDYVSKNFGSTLKKTLFDPVMEKIYGPSQLSKLSIKALKIFGLQRIVAYDREKTLELKNNPIFDERIAYHDFEDDPRDNFYFYPKNLKGIGSWVEQLESDVINSGVVLHKGKTIKKIVRDGTEIKNVILSDGTDIECNLCVWTIPPIFALLAGKVPFKGSPPQTRADSLFHIELDKPLKNKESTYIWNWDPDFKTFRVTLYPNIKNEEASYLTVEVLSTKEEAEEIETLDIFEELKKLELIEDSSKILFSKKIILPTTFPVFSSEFDNQVEKINSVVSNEFDNLVIAGRYSGKAWFVRDTLKQIYEIVESID